MQNSICLRLGNRQRCREFDHLSDTRHTRLRTPDGGRAIPNGISGTPGKVRSGVHPEKTRLIEFGRFAAFNRKQRGEGKPETFTFLGFTHFCGIRRKDRAFSLWRETAKERMIAKLQEIKTELQRRRHEPVALVGEWLRKVTMGYYRYHAVPGNLPRLCLFRWRLQWIWWRALSRRGQRCRVPFARLNLLVQRWIPVPRVLHPYPRDRFDATHPRWKPYA